MKISKENSKSYDWGESCKGWHLVNSKDLSVIQEVMPPKTKEIMHKHALSQQFFFVLKGTATFLVDAKEFIVKKGEGIYIKPNVMHQIQNKNSDNLEFLVISQPHAHGDRFTE